MSKLTKLTKLMVEIASMLVCEAMIVGAAAIVLWCANINMTSRGIGLGIIVGVAMYGILRFVQRVWIPSDD